jgi:glycosyltransferase involved in cell wall biosynthesis
MLFNDEIMHEKPKVSIVIPTYNCAGLIEETIRACLEQDYPNEKLEILVVDDGSTDNTRSIVEKYPVRYIYQENKGPAAARNNGWRSAKGEAVCFIDADCIPRQNWVSKLIQHYSRKDIVSVAGSYAVGDTPYLLDKFVHHEIRYRHSMMPDYINSFGTYNVLIKRDVLEGLGGFDPAYRRASGEDSDLSYRIIKAGYKIYFEKDALVSHRNILRFWKYLMIQFQHGYWRMKLYRKNIFMIMQDEYSYWKDFVEILLVILLLFGFLLHIKDSVIILGLLALLLFIIQLPLSIEISLREKDFRYLLFSFIMFIRSFVRGLGGIFGFIAFWIARR